MTEYPRRLIEVDLPIKQISAHARREKAIRHGHISTLHIWWARRPLAACRAVILAALWPDPADPLCPERFRVEAANVMKEWRNRRGGPQRDWSDSTAVRAALLDVIAEFANWDNSTNRDYLEVVRQLVQVAHESLGGLVGTKPLVADPVFVYRVIQRECGLKTVRNRECQGSRRGDLGWTVGFTRIVSMVTVRQ